MPFKDGKYIKLRDWLAERPEKPPLFGPDAEDAEAEEEETPAQPTNKAKRAASKGAKAAALAATGVELNLPPGIELAEGTKDIPPVSQADNVSTHLYDADLIEDEEQENA